MTAQSDSLEALGKTNIHIDEQSLEAPVHNKMVPEWLKLVSAAKQSGFSITIASGYRSFERQLLIWNAKAEGKRPILDDKGRELQPNLLSNREKVFAILRWSALPGASRHHWGSDVDIFDASAVDEGYQLKLTPEEAITTFGAMHGWLNTYLKQNDCPFFRPYSEDLGGVSPELWHISYRPIAEQYEKQLSEDAIASTIQNTEIVLKNQILKHLPEIYSRFIKNISS